MTMNLIAMLKKSNIFEAARDSRKLRSSSFGPTYGVATAAEGTSSREYARGTRLSVVSSNLSAAFKEDYVESDGEGKPSDKCSNGAAVLNMVTATVGYGILFLPDATAGAGWVTATLLCFFMACMSCISSMCMGYVLLHGRALASGGQKVTAVEDVPMVLGKKWFQYVIGCFNYADLGLYVVILLCGCGKAAWGFAWRYIDTEKMNPNWEWLRDHDDTDPQWAAFNDANEAAKKTYMRYFIAATAFGALPFSVLKNMKYIARLSIVGVGMAFTVVLMVLIESGDHMGAVNKANGSALHHTVEPFRTGTADKPAYESVLGGFGFLCFSFAVAMMVPSLVKEMKTPEDLPKVSIVAHAIIFVIKLAVALLPYFAWGKTINGDIMDNMDHKKIYAGIVCVAMFINLFIKLPLIINPIANVLEEFLEKKTNMSEVVIRYTCRIGTLLASCGVALAMPLAAGKVAAISGAVTASMISFAFPCLLHLMVAPKVGTELPLYQKGLFVFLIVVAFFIMVVGLWTSLK